MRRSKGEEVRESATYAKAKDEKRGRVPMLRFPEYRQDLAWATNKLGTHVDEMHDSNTDNVNTVLTLSSEKGLVVQEEYFNKRVASKDTYRYTPIQRDDFVYNDRSTATSPFGTIKRLSKYDRGVVSPIYLVFRPKKTIVPVFLEYYFESGCHVHEMNLIVDQGARVGRFNLTPDKFFSINLYTPQKKEQQKIAACLSSLDDLIAAHARKLETLKKYKKGLIQKLFPAEGERVPRLRFPEFVDSEEWQDQLLANCIKAVDAGVSANCFDYPALSNSDIGVLKTSCASDGFFLPNENKLVKEEERLDVKTNPLKNSILICRKNTQALVGESCFINQDYTSLFLPDLLWRLTCNEGTTDAYFFSYYLQLRRVRSAISNASTGSSASMKNISQSLFLGMKLCFPSLPEQRKIAACLSSLDDLITAQSAKVEELKEHKRGLMQGLFPSPEEEG